VTINGQAFPHLLYHFVLTYSNVEAVRVCFGETFEALAEGIEQALWQLGGVPAQHRTDHLSAAVRHLPSDEQEAFSERDLPLMRHYGMQPTWNNAGVAHENGDVEQSHFRFKEALDQALRVRGSREFSSRAADARFVQDLVRNRNLTRANRFHQEQAALRPLPRLPLAPCRELRVSVSRERSIAVLGKRYSVPSRLIGTSVLVRLRAETLEVYVGTRQVLTLPRVPRAATHAVNYRHVIWSKVEQTWGVCPLPLPRGLVSHARLPPGLRCVVQAPASARRSALRARAASGGNHWRQSEVETAITLLLEHSQVPTFDAVREPFACSPGTGTESDARQSAGL
jgi:hypothetical protein